MDSVEPQDWVDILTIIAEVVLISLGAINSTTTLTVDDERGTYYRVVLHCSAFSTYGLYFSTVSCRYLSYVHQGLWYNILLRSEGSSLDVAQLVKTNG